MIHAVNYTNAIIPKYIMIMLLVQKYYNAVMLSYST